MTRFSSILRHYQRPVRVTTWMLIAVVAGPAQAAEDGGVRSVFAEGAGLRALGLGGAYASVTEDATAPFWNVGGLGFASRAEVQAGHTNLFGEGFSEQYAAALYPSWRWGVAALTTRRFGVSGIELRDDRNLLLDDALSDLETELGLAFGRQVTPGVGLGMTLKLQHHSLAGYSDTGLGVDVGLQLRPALLASSLPGWMDGVQLGFAARNLIEPTLRLDEDTVPDPTGVRVGVSVTRPWGLRRVLLSADVEKTRDVAPRVHVGMELSILSMLDLRAAFDDGRPAAGTGVTWRDLEASYVFQDHPLSPVHRFGIAYRFGSSVEDRRQLHLARQEARLEERLAEAFETRAQARVDELFEQARGHRRNRNYLGALDRLDAVAVLAPADEREPRTRAVVLREYGLSLIESGDLAQATVMLSRAIALDPNDRATAVALAQTRRKLDADTDRSRRFSEEFQAALEAFAAGDLARARTLFSTLLAQAPRDTEVATMLSRTEQAIESRLASELDHANTLLEVHQLDAAETALKRAEGLAPGDGRVVSLRARLRTARTPAPVAATSPDSPPADAAPEPPRVLTPDEAREVEALYQRGLTAIEEGRVDDAIRYWTFVWTTAPGHGQVRPLLTREHVSRGMESFAAGRFESAIADWEAALQITPDDRRVIGYLERARRQQERLREITDDTRTSE